ncbi:MAG TPA: PHP domain-containing protein [Gemmatimonadales bacterium]|nr:PHP domain-containing protein [Gemmatimonadales bacterium]
MDRPGDGVPALSPVADLHAHSTASDGLLAPEAVVARAAGAGVRVLALTDHDTLAGVPAATAAGERLGVRVIAGCEFSTLAPWGGEMHVLGYFLPAGDAAVEEFLARCRDDRRRRVERMLEKLAAHGAPVARELVEREAAGGALGRPHVARALVAAGHVADQQAAFDRFLGRGRPAYVDKALPSFKAVATLVHAAGGVVSAAHLKDRGTRGLLAQLKAEGLDAVETRHPSHDPDQRARLTDLALALDLARTGGSDWHGDGEGYSHGELGSQEVPLEWVDALEGRRGSRST